MNQAANVLDVTARRVIRASEEDLRRWMPVDNDLLGAIYLQVREALDRAPSPDDAADDVALAIYLTASAWNANGSVPLALLSSLHQVIARTLEKENSMKSRVLCPLLALLLIFSISTMALAEDAAAIFKSRCTPCHGADGSGNTPMGKKVGAKSLGSAEVQKMSDAELTSVVKAGKGKMPAFGTLNAAQLTDLVKLIRGFKK